MPVQLTVEYAFEYLLRAVIRDIVRITKMNTDQSNI
jgi:hypothetical protein